MSVQNYHCNVLLLNQCTSQEQLQTCVEVCDTLNDEARRSLDTANRNANYADDFSTGSDDSDHARVRQILRRIRLLLEEAETLQTNSIRNTPQRMGVGRMKVAKEEEGKKRVALGLSSSSEDGRSNIHHRQPYDYGNNEDRYVQQEQHLNILSSNLEELQYMGNSIGSTLQGQNELVSEMDGQAEHLVDRTRSVVRRADRISQYSIWRSIKSDFQYWAIIQHLPSNRYLTVLPNRMGNTISLEDDFRSDSSTFGVYTRRKSQTTIGLLNKCTNRWLGQSMLGYMACKASRFGYREEWELDEAIRQSGAEFELGDPIAHNTKILCCCANSGQGGWLKVDGQSGALEIGDFSFETKCSAPLWSVIVLDDAANLE